MSVGIYFEVEGADAVPQNVIGAFPEALGPFDVAPTCISPKELTIDWGLPKTWALREKTASLPRAALKDAATARLAAALPEVIPIVLSPLHPVNLTPEQAQGAGIPSQSKHFTWAYPADLSAVPAAALDNADHPDVAFLSVGAFIYFDASLNALQINALVGRGCGTLSFGAPKPWMSGWRESLESKNKTFHRITLPSLLRSGFTRFTWIPPNTIIGGQLSEGGVRICPFGGFAYLKEETAHNQCEPAPQEARGLVLLGRRAMAAEALQLDVDKDAGKYCQRTKEEAPANQEPQARPQSMQIKIGASEVSVTAEQDAIDLVKTVNAAPFKEWVGIIEKDPRVVVDKILVQSVDMFGPRVGFIKFKADVKVDGKAAPGIVFMRGGAVAVLVVLRHETTDYTLLVRQPRVAVGKSSLPEIPAGMLDGEGRFSGVAAKELKEETGIHIEETDLIDMTHLAWGDEYPGMYPSCGGSDEFNRIFLYRKQVSAVELEDMQGRLHGVASEGEMIKLEVIPLAELWKVSPDAKALGALCLHHNLTAEGKIPQLEVL